MIEYWHIRFDSSNNPVQKQEDMWKKLILKQSLNYETIALHIWKFGKLLLHYTTVKLVLHTKETADMA
jgi:hypothetical protein